MNKLFFGVVLPLIFLTACSPRVTTKVIKSYPLVVAADSVCVYESGDYVPNSAEPIGYVSVTDAGTTTKCKYDQVLRIAKEETAKIGGNGFAITDHKSLRYGEVVVIRYPVPCST